MFPAQFEYHRAGSVRGVLALIKQFGEDAKLLSGGHSLLPMMKLRLLQPEHLIDIGRIVELRQITEQGGKVVIGATCTHDQISRSELIRGKIGLIAECAAAIGDDRIQLQSRGYVVPDSFTHGTSAQRARWFRRGFQTGDLRQGDTFNAKEL